MSEPGKQELGRSPAALARLAHAFLDACEEEMLASGPRVECPVKHQFTPGLYSREIFMRAGTLLTSKIHKTEHPFVVSQGKVSVWTEEAGVVTLTAPHTGITRAGTRRLLYVHEDTVWTTFHPTTLTDVEAIEEQIIETRDECRARLQTIETEEAKCLG